MNANEREMKNELERATAEASVYAVRPQLNTPEIDLLHRILRGVVVATRSLAEDGYIIEPMGIDLSLYLQNPQVGAKHGKAETLLSPCIGRALAIGVTPQGLMADVQFADTTLGRDYAYLHGVNPEKEVYMRAWSIAVSMTSKRMVTLAEGKRLAGDGWNEDIAKGLPKEFAGRVGYAEKTLMREFSSVYVGADRGALTRAFSNGCATAGNLVSEIDLKAAGERIAALERERGTDRARIETLERDIQALRDDGASAVSRGDSEAIVRQLDEMLAVCRQRERTERT